MTSSLAKLWMIPQDGPVQLMAFDAIAYNDRRFVIGEGIGEIGPNGAVVSPICQEVLNRICSYADVANDQVWLVEIANAGRIQRRLRQTFAQAPSGSVIMLLCHTPALIDALRPFLTLMPPRETPLAGLMKQ
jgi:hypothetical protein